MNNRRITPARISAAHRSTTHTGLGSCLAAALALALAACGGGGTSEPPPDQVSVMNSHNWRIAVHQVNGETVDVVPSGSSHDHEVNVDHDLGVLYTVPWKIEPRANAEVYANVAGDTYWVAAEAPQGDMRKPSSPTGSFAYLDQIQTFRKTSDAATMDLVISESTLEAVDFNPSAPQLPGCQQGSYWMFNPPPAGGISLVDYHSDCGNLIDAKLLYEVFAWKEVPIKDSNGKVTGFGKVDLAHGSVFAQLSGYIKGVSSPFAPWHFTTGSIGDSNLKFKVGPNFFYSDNVDQDADQTHAFVALENPYIIQIPLDLVNKDEEFKLIVVATADVNNQRQLESYVSARFRDPQKLGGVSVQKQGVEIVAVPADTPYVPPVVEVLPAPACAGGTDPASGSVQFQTGLFVVNEGTALGRTPVWVTRTGGGVGEVTVRLSTQDGTARADTDYQTVSTLVRFGDGEQGSRYVMVPITNNQTLDPERILTLTLTDLRGCAVPGKPTTAWLAIVDDETPPPSASTFTLGGTVSGLAGTGLTLRTGSGETVSPAADGSFVFGAAFNDGLAYTVSISAQPLSPGQVCSVVNGSGTIAGANVTNINVSCTTPPPNGSLDASFGSGGKVSNTLPAAKAVALQADGKLLALGGLTLSRYNADGSADTSFGTAGKLTIVANGGVLDAMQALAVQADGRIVVAGYTATPLSVQDDMIVLRFNADGSADTSFGNGGKVVTDFAGNTDRAYAVLVQGDARIVVAGIATLGSGASVDQDIALVRHLADGSLDPSFGSGGKVTTNIAGKSDFGYAAALQADGKIVIAGRVASTGGANPDFGVARYLASGSLDTTFGTSGTVRVDFVGDVWDEAADLAIQSDGKIVVGGQATTAGKPSYALIRLDGGGVLDPGFGSSGRVSSDFSGLGDRGAGLALQADGRIVLVGRVSEQSNGNFGIARYLGNGTLDTSFGMAGLVTVDFFGAIDGANDVALQADGKIVVVGAARNGATTGLGIVRVLP